MKSLILITLITLSGICLKAQSNLDSLWGIWNDTSADPEVRLETIDLLIFEGYLFNKPDSAYILASSMLELAIAVDSKNRIGSSTALKGGSFYFRSEYDSALHYFEKAILIYEEAEILKPVASIYGNMANIYIDQGNYQKGIECYMRSLKSHEKNNHQRGMAIQMMNIGIVHKDLNDPEEAMKYFRQALAIQEELNYEMGQADCQLNMAVIYVEAENHEAALPLLDRCAEIYKTVEDKQGKAFMFNLYGLIYFQLKDYNEALSNFNQALTLQREMEDDQGIATTLSEIGQVYMALGQPSLAIAQYEKAKKIGQDIGAIAPLTKAADRLSKAYQNQGDLARSVENYELFVQLTDSTRNEENQMALIRQEYSYTYEKKVFQDSIVKAEEALVIELAYEKKLRRKDTTRNIAIGSGLFLLLLVGGLLNRNRYIKKSRDLISIERDRSESLLLNILPAEIAEELKNKGRADARDFDLASILFTDFIRFTEISSKMSAQDLVAEINSCFESFDAIMAKYGIEKIKTIGDAYMAAGGLPVPSVNSLANTVKAALEMQVFINNRKKELDEKGLPAFEMRVGIHSGPVVAGIVGVKKFQYDIWGDTVNTASRMESSGELGKVNISQATYAMLKDNPDFIFESRGRITAKGKGEIEMWFVEMKPKQA
jgi:class 3 adenylate cyclase/predicted negative regulator of RcsB-dependent stress response